MSQLVKLPTITKCHCGATARVIDWNYNLMYKVYCDNNHSLPGKNITVNRAIHKWNNAINKADCKETVIITHRLQKDQNENQ